jgi:hypothetical protein
VIPYHTHWNPNPFVGDVQLRDFTSFIYGLVQWRAMHDSYTWVEFNSNLIVREKYPMPSVIIEYYRNLLQDLGDSQIMRVHRQYFITNHQEVSQTHSLWAMLSSQDIWHTLPNTLRIRIHVGYPHFKLSLSRVSLYINSMKRHDYQWLGIIFDFPLI